MNWQKLNEVETYTNLWKKFKGLFHRNHKKNNDDIADDNNSSVYVTVEGKDKDLKQINLGEIVKAGAKHWYLYIIWCIIAFAISCFIILPVPRYYSSTVKLAPELSNMMGGGSLSSIAEQFGVNLNSKSLDGGDAILPELYPDVISSVDFMTELFPIHVESNDGTINTTYYDYLAFHQKSCWWQRILDKIHKKIEKALESHAGGTPQNLGNPNEVNPFKLTKKQTNVCDMIKDKVKCNVDKKNYVISISVEDQDPLISATIADSVKAHLQKFITKYRTQKAANDLQYTLKLQADAKKRYEKARRDYAAYSDAHQDVILQEYQSKMEDMENEMQLRYNSYSALATQVQAARAKLREQTPAFTKLQSATVAVKPAGPKRMLFVAVCLLIAIIIVTIYSVNAESNKSKFKKVKKNTKNEEDTDTDNKIIQEEEGEKDKKEEEKEDKDEE